LWLGPARAQSQAEYDACIDLGFSEAECAHLLPTDGGSGGTDGGSGGTDGGSGGTDGGSGGTDGGSGGTDGGSGGTDGGSGGTDGGSGGTDGGSGGTDGGSTPPAPPQCASGKHGGHAVAAAGNARGHRCVGDQRGDHRRHKYGHRAHDHRAKAKALVRKFVAWCQAFASNRGRH
jgi:hypothetical protein